MRALHVCVLLFALAPTPAFAQPAHPAVRYSCMGEPSDGSGWPWVAEGVPQVIEILHPGYEIGHYGGFTVAGLDLFVIRGGMRRAPAPERFSSVEAVDETGAFVGGRALFVRAAISTTDPGTLARHAMAFLLRRADERPLAPRTASELGDSIRDRIVEPWLEAGTLHFWVRADSTSPYASEVVVELATGIHHGDVW